MTAMFGAPGEYLLNVQAEARPAVVQLATSVFQACRREHRVAIPETITVNVTQAQ